LELGLEGMIMWGEMGDMGMGNLCKWDNGYARQSRHIYFPQITTQHKEHYNNATHHPHQLQPAQ
jgi:hypothetical protein